MKTKLTKLMFALFAVMVGTSVNAQTSGTCGYPNAADVTWSYEGTTLTISGTGAMADYAYGEAPWSAYESTLKYVEIEEGVTSVGNNAFAGFTALKSVTFPSTGFTSIGEYAFSGCTSFKNLNMPSTMTTIGDGAFSGSAVRGATIYSGVTKIGDYAFESCAYLDGVAIYEGVEEIGEGAFDGCAFTSVVIPSTVTTIADGAFMSNEALESVYIGAGVTNIGATAFQGCTSLTSVGLGGATAPILGDAVFDQGDGETPLSIDAFYVPSTTPYSGGWGGYAAAKFKTVYEAAWENSNDPAEGSGTWSFNVTTGELTVNGTGNLNVSPWMGMSAINPELYDNEHPGYWSKVLSFVVGEGITHIQTLGVGMQINCASVTLPSTLKYVGYSCLEECAFTSIELPEGLETIDDYTFFDSKLTSLTIPSTVTYIGSSAFLANEDLATITCLPATPPDLGEYEPCFGDGSTITAIYVPAGSVDAYKNWEWDKSIGYTGWDGWKTYAAKINAKFFTAVGDYQWATFYDGTKDYEVDANTTVYKASLTGTTLTLTEIGGNQIITAGNAVIMKSTSAPVLTETATASTADFSGNELHGSASPVVSDGTLYALSYKSGTLGFFKVKNGTSIPAGKAYLSTADAAREYFEFTYDNDVTSIESVASSHQTIANGQYYDMQGRKVFKPTKGLYIVNGKKVIVK